MKRKTNGLVKLPLWGCCISQDPLVYTWIISADFIQEATQSIPSGPECLAFCGFAESIALSAKSLLKAAALLFVALINSFNGV